MLHRLLLSILMISLLLGTASGCTSVFGIDDEQEIALGNEAAPKFLKEGGGHIPDEQVHQYANGIFLTLLSHVPPDERRDLPWEFHTLNSKVVNAFALPGGKVFITRGLMTRLSTEAQLAGVIGHEIGHVVGHHISRQIARQRGLGILVTVAGAATESNIPTMLGNAGGNLYLLSFGRGQELEADQYGMKYMRRAGYDPRGMRDVMEILAEAGGGGGIEMLSTHPHPTTRIGQADDLLSTKYANTQNNPSFVVNREAYQSNVLDRLQNLPPPPDAKE